MPSGEGVRVLAFYGVVGGLLVLVSNGNVRGWKIQGICVILRYSGGICERTALGQSKMFSV